MALLPRDVAQTMIEKLDRNLTKASEAKKHAARTYNVKLTGRTRDEVVKSITQNMEA